MRTQLLLFICLVPLAAAYLLVPPPTYSATYNEEWYDLTGTKWSEYNGMFFYDIANQRLLLNATGFYLTTTNATIQRTFSILYLPTNVSGPYIMYDEEHIETYSACYPQTGHNPFDPSHYTYDTVVGNQTVNGTTYMALSNSSNSVTALVYPDTNILYQTTEIWTMYGDKTFIVTTFTNPLLSAPASVFALPSVCNTTQAAHERTSSALDDRAKGSMQRMASRFLRIC